MDAITELGNLTYQIEHNPNCPSPFLIRVVTPGTGRLDKLHTTETRDTFAYGKTLEEAVTIVVVQMRWLEKHRKDS